jgi:hypothetical protein
MDEQAQEKRRAKFSVMEDLQLRQLVAEYGVSNWAKIASLMPDRNLRQCRERWKHYLSATRLQVPWTVHEDQLLLEKVQAWGPRWTRIASFMGTRTDIEVKTRWFQKFNMIVPLLPRASRIAAEQPPSPLTPRGSDKAIQPSTAPDTPTPQTSAISAWREGRSGAFAPIGLPSYVQDWFSQLVASETA